MSIKPLYEPIIIARKPFNGSLVDNIVKWGVGGLNIDECRVDFINAEDYKITANKNQHEKFGTKPMTNNNVYGDYSMIQPKNYSASGRFPANTILGYDSDCEDEVCGGMPDTIGSVRQPTGNPILNPKSGWNNNSMIDKTVRGFEDEGSASRYFKNLYYTDKDIDNIEIEIDCGEEEGKGMRLYSEGNSYKLYQGNMLDMLEVIEPNSIDSIVTDPPYELNFMGKGWDRSGIAFQAETWNKCLQVLKPGGYLLAFGGSRTYHRIACAIEDAGFEIRDTIMWLYGSGFPKSLNIANSLEGRELFGSANKSDYKKLDGVKGVTSLGFNKKNAEDGWRPNNYNGQETTLKANITTDLAKKWQGWGTALKPSFEPIIVARKPFAGSLVDNVIKYGVGGINIDECRVGTDVIGGGTMPDLRDVGRKSKETIGIDKLSFGQVENAQRIEYEEHIGRFPANTILTYDEADEEEVCGGFPTTKTGSIKPHINRADAIVNKMTSKEITSSFNGDSGSASRYFYCAKASKKDRDEGLVEFDEIVDCDRNPDSYSADTAFNRSANARKNTHPTVKPTDLMQYLIRLVTPNGGIVLDPFNGSGSTGKAVMWENRERLKNYKYIGIELTPEYLPISKARIEYAADPNNIIVREEIDEETEEVTKVSYKEVSLF